MRLEYFSNTAVDRLEPLGEWILGLRTYRSVLDQPMSTAIAVEYSVSGRLRPAINAQNSHALYIMAPSTWGGL